MERKTKYQLPEETKQELQTLSLNILHLKSLLNSGTLTTADVTLNELKKKEFKLKEQSVLEVHHNKILYKNRPKNGKDRMMYVTYLFGGCITCMTYEGMIEKLFEIYFGDARVGVDYSFKGIFEAALAQKILEEGPKDKTVIAYQFAYKALVNEELANLDIRDISTSYLKIYLMNYLENHEVDKKRLYKLKGILNLVFQYACDPERHYLKFNPVPTNNKPFLKKCIVRDTSPEAKVFSGEDITKIISHVEERVRTMDYDVNGYAILFSIETGVREAEIPSLKWEDIHENYIHIHSQQLDEKRDGKKVFYYVPYTKNEKGIPKGGRRFPMTTRIRFILNELYMKQQELGIESEWVFARLDGSWTTTISYYESLYKICKKLGLKRSNNHAFRMALNSYVLVPAGIEAPDRAKMLGHTVEVNLRNYTFAKPDEEIAEFQAILDGFADRQRLGTGGYSTVIDFSAKRRALEKA